MAASFKIADAYVEVETHYDKDTLTKGLDGAITSESEHIRTISRTRLGKAVGDGMSEGASNGFRNGMRRRADGDGRSIARSLVSKIASPFASGLIQAVSLGFARGGIGRAMATNPFVASTGAAIGALLATTIAAGLAATLSAALAGALGAGVIGLGYWLMMDEPEVQRAGARLGDTFNRTFKTAAGAMLMPFVGALNIFSASILRMQPTIDRIFRTLSPAILPLAEGLAGFMEAMGPGLEALAEVGADVLIDLGKNLPGWGRNISDFFILIRDNWPEIKRNLDEFFSDLGTALGMLSAAFIWLSKNYHRLKAIMKGIVLPPALRFLIKHLGTDWGNDWNRLIAWFRGIPGRIGQIFQFLLTAARTKMANFWPTIRGFFSGAGVGMRIQAGRMVAGFIRFFATLPGKARTQAIRAKNAITSFFSGAGSWLWNAGWNIISGLVSGISSAANSILRGMLNWVTGLIPSWKGPESRDKKLLTPNGEWLIESLMTGVGNKLPAFKRQMTGMTGRIPDYVSAGSQRAVAESSVSYGGHTFNTTVNAGMGADGERISRAVIAKLRQMLDDYDRSLVKR